MGGTLHRGEESHTDEEAPSVADVWTSRSADAEAATRAISRQLDELEARKRRLVAAFVHCEAIDRTTYEQRADQLDEGIALAEMQLEHARLPVFRAVEVPKEGEASPTGFEPVLPT